MKRKLTPEEQRRIDETLEFGRRAQENMQRVIARLDVVIAELRARAQAKPQPER